MRPRSFRILLACLLSLLLAVGAAPSVARAADGELRAPLPEVPALLDVWAVSGDDVLAVMDGKLKVSHDRGATWTAADLPAWASGDPTDVIYILGLDEGLALLTDEEQTRVALYSLAENRVTEDLSLPEGYVESPTSTHALVSGGGYRLVALGGGVDRELPAGYEWRAALDGGFVAGYLWGDDDERTIMLADSSNNVSEIATVDVDADVWFGANTIVWQQGPNSATICARTTDSATTTCQTLTDATGDLWVRLVLLEEGVLANIFVEEAEETHPLVWVPRSGGDLQEPQSVKLGSDVMAYDVVQATDAPAFSTLTATESYLEWLSTDASETTRVATGARETSRQVVAGLTPTDVLLQGQSPDYAATTWRRSVGSSIGEASSLAAIDGSRASTSAHASAGRWLVPTAETEVTLYDRGEATETITGLYEDGHFSGYDAVGGLSGPNLLLERNDTWQVRNAAGTWMPVPQARAIFGGLVLEDLSDYDADEFVPKLRVRDLSGDGAASVGFTPPGYRWGSSLWWGDLIAYRDAADEATVVYNFRTRQVVWEFDEDPVALGDGVLITMGEEFVYARNLATGARVELGDRRTIWRNVAVDGPRVAFTTDTDLVIRTIPGVVMSAPGPWRRWRLTSPGRLVTPRSVRGPRRSRGRPRWGRR